MVQVLVTTITDSGAHSRTTVLFFPTIEAADEAAKRINSKYMSWAKNYAMVLN